MAASGDMFFETLLAAASIAAGAIASVAGFGIGSILTPVFALRVDMQLAVAAVAIPHLAATALRLSMMRQHVDWRLVRTFGVMSAAGGLAGALLQQRLRGPGLVMVFGALLVFAGLTGLTGVDGAGAPGSNRRVDRPDCSRACSAAWSATRAASDRPRCSASTCGQLRSSRRRPLRP